MKFYRGIKTSAPTTNEPENALLIEKLKFEFESIKSIINERGVGGTTVALGDFCKQK